MAVVGFLLLTAAPVIGGSAYDWTHGSSSDDRLRDIWYVVGLAASLSFVGMVMVVSSVKRLLKQIKDSGQ